MQICSAILGFAFVLCAAIIGSVGFAMVGIAIGLFGCVVEPIREFALSRFRTR